MYAMAMAKSCALGVGALAKERLGAAVALDADTSLSPRQSRAQDVMVLAGYRRSAKPARAEAPGHVPTAEARDTQEIHALTQVLRSQEAQRKKSVQTMQPRLKRTS